MKIKRSELPPGPRMPPAMQMIGLWSRPRAFSEKCRARYGKRFTVRPLASPPFVILSEPDQIEQVFKASPEVLQPGRGARVIEPVVGSKSVLLLDGSEHMEQRKLMLPAFHGERIERLTGLISEVTEREVASWPGGESIALHPRMQELTLEIILRAVFGLDPGERLEALRSRLRELLSFGDRPISLIPIDPNGRLGKALERWGPIARFWELEEEIDALLSELIDERRRDPGERDDVLAMLLAARHEDGSPMSFQELRDELMTLLVAGHETTASTLAWGFERLIRTPEALARLIEEIRDGDGDQYLTATINETLRRRPVLPNVAPRFVIEPIEVGGWHYPPGVCLVPSTYLLHHDPDVYPDPYSFRPERFLGISPGTYTWIPFGGGRRRCLGASFALLEMKIVLRSILATREVEAAGNGFELATRRNITIRPSDGARAVLA